VMRPTAAIDGQPLIGTPVRRAPDGGFYTEAEFNAYFNDEGYVWACALGYAYGPYKSYLLGNAKNAIGYVGICKDVPMRLGEHNGDLGSLDRGAHVTKRFRPWSVRIIVDGLFTRRDAGAFEWAWQRPFDAPYAFAPGRFEGIQFSPLHTRSCEQHLDILCALILGPRYRDRNFVIVVPHAEARESLVESLGGRAWVNGAGRAARVLSLWEGPWSWGSCIEHSLI
jgi:predicted GIY-YIG superfamily endonuclease